MINKEVYRYFERALPPRLCDEIIEYGNNLRKQKGSIGLDAVRQNTVRKLTRKEKAESTNMRKSNIAWIKDPWVYKEIVPYIHEANSIAGWNFEIEHNEPIQFTEYKKGQYYDYHIDSFHGDEISRKISMTVNLSDENDYEGGDLYFKYLTRDKYKLVEETRPEFRKKGTLCVFPSFELHKVSEVKKGTRYSLVLWSTGKAFK